MNYLSNNIYKYTQSIGDEHHKVTNMLIVRICQNIDLYPRIRTNPKSQINYIFWGSNCVI